MRTRTVLAAALVGALAFGATTARADNYDEASTFSRVGYGMKSAALNVLPGVSVLADDTCFQGYMLCKLTFASFGLVAGFSQFVLGTDLEGVERTWTRAFTGDWLITPRQVANGTGADPYPQLDRTSDDSYLPDF